ncbi:MAG: hypothetical protein WCE75_09195 [Terracidiphilus sp.]
MPLDLAMSVMSSAEIGFWAVLAFLFWKKDLHRRFPAMGSYLALRAISTPALAGALWIQSQPWGHGYYPLYYYPYWAVYIASAVLIYFACIEIFRSALAPFPGLARFGVVIFRWMALASAIVTLSSLPLSHHGPVIIPAIAFGLMRTVSILELCLLAFLCLSMNALRLSVRDMAFGLSLGFGLMSANDFILASLIPISTSLTTPLQFVYQSLMLGTLGLWIVFFVAPEPARQPVVVPVNSTLYRWNEIASALGHTGTQVAVPQPANSFFLTDVEKVVDTVLKRTLPQTEAKAQGNSRL